MAYHDQQGQYPAYNQYPPQPQQQYIEHDEFNPYNNNINNNYQSQQQDYNAYNQQGRYDYHDNPYGGGYVDDPAVQPPVSKEQQSERSVFEHDDFAAPKPRGPKWVFHI